MALYEIMRVTNQTQEKATVLSKYLMDLISFIIIPSFIEQKIQLFSRCIYTYATDSKVDMSVFSSGRKEWSTLASVDCYLLYFARSLGSSHSYLLET